jgi:hypothetical protein
MLLLLSRSGFRTSGEGIEINNIKNFFQLFHLCSRAPSLKSSMEVQRHPTVEDDPSRLTAYDICNREDRYKILECMSAIKRKLLNGESF